jgi:hypothetical protein
MVNGVWQMAILYWWEMRLALAGYRVGANFKRRVDSNYKFMKELQRVRTKKLNIKIIII